MSTELDQKHRDDRIALDFAAALSSVRRICAGFKACAEPIPKAITYLPMHAETCEASLENVLADFSEAMRLKIIGYEAQLQNPNAGDEPIV